MTAGASAAAARAREALLARVQAKAELDRRRKVAPLAYHQLWDAPAPRTSQRRALALATEPGALLTLLLGGNRTGKSEAMAAWCIATAAGLDATLPGVGRWVARWVERNGLNPDGFPRQPGVVWFCSPSFAAAAEQVQVHLRRLAPSGSGFRSWGSPLQGGELELPGGGRLLGKAYTQYANELTRQAWEGAAIQGLGLDEEPASQDNLAAGLSRLVDLRGRAVLALTPLRGKNWLHREYIASPKPWARAAWLHGADNPHIPQAWRELMLASVPAWQRAARDRGEFCAPEGQVFALDSGVHRVPRFRPPAGWIRWVGIDWGARSPHVLWACEPPDGEGPVVVYREYAPRRTSLEPGVSDRALIARAIELTLEDGDGIVLWVADSESPGAIQEAAEQGVLVQPALKGKGSVRAGIDLIAAMLATVDPLTQAEIAPRLQFTEDCPVLWEELEGMVWPQLRSGQDADEVHPLGADHGPDALRYILQERDRLGFR